MKMLNSTNHHLRTKALVKHGTSIFDIFGGSHAPAEGVSTRTETGKQCFELVLVADDQADDPFGVRRLRMALKVLRRRFGLRCVSAEASEVRKPNPEGEYSYPFSGTKD